MLTRPRLQLTRQGDGTTILLDTRGLERTEIKTELTPGQIDVLLDCEKYTGNIEQKWALERKAAIVEGVDFISLVTIDPKLRNEYESK